MPPVDHKTPPDSGFIQGLRRTRRFEREPRWLSERGDRIYVWDGFHGHLEVYNKRGLHLGVADPLTGAMIASAVPGRSIDV
jgi:hypothetical protein